ncbi:MAG TPA: flippase-like domain-containing protein [Flavobacteriales bacterium]|nr:flippase-like domain-containing protein [Flavobacteriales bacterium]
MKNTLFNIIKVVLPLLVGVYIIWAVFGQLEAEEKESMFTSLEQANYSWIAISIVFGILSHVSRAYRWQYLLSPLGYRVRFMNSFFSVMIGYLINLILPRVGEVSRCGIMSRYEKISFSKLFGTVIAERIADMTILGTIMIVVILTQLATIKNLVLSILPQDIDIDNVLMVIGLTSAILAVLSIAIYQVLKRSVNTIIVKIKGALIGIVDGLKTIVRMEHSGKFILHTLFIWTMYMTMFYVCFFSLEATSRVPLGGILAAFAVGGLSLIFIQGGIGIYPAAIMKVLLLYGVADGPGGALGWIIWTSQTLMLLILGLMSITLVSWYNRKFLGHENAEPDPV